MTLEPGTILTAIDPGAARTQVVVGRYDGQRVEVLATGVASTVGVNQLDSADVSAIATAMVQAVEQARRSTTAVVDACWLSVPSSWVQSTVTEGRVEPRRGAVRRDDVRDALRAACGRVETPTRLAIHHRVLGWTVDGRRFATPPVGVRGRELGVEVQVTICPRRTVDIVERACREANIRLEGLMLETMAAGSSTLTSHEREQGVALVDMGATKTTLAIWRGGVLVHHAVLPAGGDELTEAIAQHYRVGLAEACRIKEGWGCALVERVSDVESFDVEPLGGLARRESRLGLAQLLEPMVAELYHELGEELERAAGPVGVRTLVLCGGGAWLDGAAELASQAFRRRGVEVRLGIPGGVGGCSDLTSSTRFAVAVGLLIEASLSTRATAFYMNERARVVRQRKQFFRDLLRKFL